MRFEGFMVAPKGAKNKFWHIEVPALCLATQGSDRKDALRMMKDAIELAVDRKGFRVDFAAGKDGDTFTVGAMGDNSKILLGFMLKQRRGAARLTLDQVAKKMGSNSPNAYARYEKGGSDPSMEKLSELLDALSSDFVLEIRPKQKLEKVA